MSIGLRAGALLALAAALAGLAAWRLTVDYDLAAFLPPPNTAAEKVLVTRLGKDAGARSIFVVLPDAGGEDAAGAAAALRDLPGIERVLPDHDELGPAAIPTPLWRHRLLLAAPPTDEAAWRDVLKQRLADAALADSDDALALIAADPLLASVEALAEMGAGGGSFRHGNERYLLVLASAASFDVGAQTAVVGAMRQTLRDLGLATARLYGSGIYAADLQDTVRREAALFSLLAGGALLGLLLWRFRSFAVVLAIGAPMLFGAAAGLAVLSSVYAQVHGIALAFGFTLLGVTVDYPLHLLSGRDRRARGAAVWPTLRVGIASTLLAYGVFVFSGSEGLRQLGVFALCGVAAAALGAAWIGNAGPPPAPGAAPSAHRVRLRHWPWLATLAMATVALVARSPFVDDLGALTPVPTETLAADAELRTRLGVGDLRHLVAVRGANLDATLARTEATAAILDAAQRVGEIERHASIVGVLPSRALQDARRSAWRSFVGAGGIETDGHFGRAAAALGFAEDAFRPFHEAAVAVADSATGLDREAFVAEPALRSLLDAHLYRMDAEWTSLIRLHGVGDPDAVADRLAGLEGAVWVDAKQASESLVAGFRERLLVVLAVALALAGILLWLRTRDVARAVWLLGTVLAAATGAAALCALLRGAVSPFDLMALALVAGLGLDYTLFHSKPLRDANDAVDTRRAVDICALSSFLVFGILAFSSIPVLGGLGTTVAAGVAAAYVLARFGRYANSGN